MSGASQAIGLNSQISEKDVILEKKDRLKEDWNVRVNARPRCYE